MLKATFFQRPAPVLAPDLLGKKLVRVIGGERLVGIITETEAYQGQEDLACHAHFGKTKRNAVMFGEAGRAYIYFTYGMHWMLNVVADLAENPAAVLIRAVFPVEGLQTMALHRPNLAFSKKWLNGPGKLTQAFALDGTLNALDLRDPESGLFIENGIEIPANLVSTSPRIGLGKTPEPWLSLPWRWEVGWQHAKEIIEKETG